MSKSVDQRIVNMQFDNKQFEQGIGKSIDSLNKLNKSLNLEEGVKGLNNVEKASKSISFTSLQSGVETVTAKFSAMGVVGITALTNITNKAINAGTQLVKSLTVDPIKAGLDEYETKIGAIQTILTNTASKGTTLEDVNKALAELNTYADKTIYNFAEMTRNIGTFTAAGVTLEDSVVAIQGIANLAAGSGSSALQASTAMYQLSQALAAGTLKLQDWNSVVNAGMGGELFQTALKDMAKSMGIVVNEAVPFRESLESGWITTEVLIATLQKFANDPMLTQAATEVKTFTQMLDTMKESVQSGWSMSWEYILGDKQQSAELFTAINNGFESLTAASAEARNEMLKFWNQNGGRDAIITALANAFNGLMSVLTPIKEAFYELFPSMTGQQLTDLSMKVKELSERFTLSETTINNIKRTFSGLFAILDIGRQALMPLISGFGQIVSSILPAGDGILGFTARIGDWLVALNESIRTSGIFTDVIGKVADVLSNVGSSISDFVKRAGTAFSEFGSNGVTSFKEFIESLGLSFAPFEAMGKVFSKVIDTFSGGIDSIIPAFKNLASNVGVALKNVVTFIGDFLNNTDFNQFFDLINGGIFAAILLSIKGFISSLTSITDGAGGMFDGITDVLDGVKDSLEAYQNNIKMDSLIKIAAAIGIFAASLVALSLVDPTRLLGAVAAMTVMMGELLLFLNLFNEALSGTRIKDVVMGTTVMFGLSTAVLVLSMAVNQLAKNDWDGLLLGLTGVTALCAILVKTAKSLSSNTNGIIRGSAGFVIFAAAINVLTSAVSKLSTLDVGGLTKGLVGVGVLMTELSLFMKATDMNNMGMMKATGILIMASALNVMAIAVGKIGSIDVNSLIKGLGAMGVIFAELSLFINLTGGANKTISTAIGMTILAGAMTLFAKAVDAMGSLNIETIVKGLSGMGGALLIIAGGMTLMPSNMIGKSTAMIALAASLNILSTALEKMGNNSWEEVGRSLVMLAGSLGTIATAMLLMQTALPGAAALVAISGALMVLTPVLKILGGMSLGEIGKSILALVGVFAVLGGAGVLLAPLTPVLLAVTGAILALGVGCGLVGAGIAAFSVGFTALAVSGAAGAASLVVALSSVIGLIPAAANSLAKGVVEFIQILGNGGEAIATSITKIVKSVLGMIVELTPDLVSALGSLLDILLTVIVDYVPEIVEGGIKLILGLLEGISRNIEKVISTAIDVVVNFINGIASKISDVIQSGVNLILNFVNGMADALRNNTPAMIAAFNNLFSAVIQSALQVLFGSINSFIQRGTELVKGIINGVQSTVSALVNAVASLITSAVGAVKNGVKDFTNAGKDLINGLINGIKGMVSSAVNAVKNLGSSIVSSFKKVLGIHSPSRVFAEMGGYIDQGLVKGISDGANSVAKTSQGLGDTAISAMQRAMSEVNDILKFDVDSSPTIRPVMDLSNLKMGVGSMNKMLNTNPSISLASNIASKIGNVTQDNTLQKLIDAINITPNNTGNVEINVYSSTGNPMDISRQIQRDCTKINRALGRV